MHISSRRAATSATRSSWTTRCRGIVRASLLAAMVVMIAASATAQVPDLVVVGEQACMITCPGPLYEVEWFGPTYGHRLGPNNVKTIESAPGGRMFGLSRDHPSAVVEVFSNGSIVPRTASMTGFALHDLTVAPSGAIYVLASVEGNAGRLLVFNPDGTLAATRPIAGPVGAFSRIDLAADQCTLFYTGPFRTIRRVNGCTGAALPDFAHLPASQEIGDLRVLPDGGLLISDVMRGLVRFNAAGAETQTYSRPSTYPAAIGLTDNGATALFGAEELNATMLGRLDLASGTITRLTALAGYSQTFSVTPRLAWTAALGASAHNTQDVPTLSTWAMIAAMVMLTVLAVRRM